tara:strand:+ start:734 stop:961 length:228 start_codon:yes stop_codon:yes gene_type:complete
MLLRTPDAAQHLQVSQSYLKRLRDTHGGFLVGGEHYFLGASSNASIRWDVSSIQRELHKRGRIQREAEQLLKELA